MTTADAFTTTDATRAILRRHIAEVTGFAGAPTADHALAWVRSASDAELADAWERETGPDGDFDLADVIQLEQSKRTARRVAAWVSNGVRALLGGR